MHMPELHSVAGSSGSLGLPSAAPRSTAASGSGMPDTLLPGTQTSTEGPVVASAGLPGLGKGLLCWQWHVPPLFFCPGELTFPVAEEEIKRIMIIVLF